MRILLCDDEANFLNVLCAHVQEYMNNHYVSCDITSTTNPAEVISSHDTYSLAFLDIQMDDIDGLSLAKELKKRNSKLVLFFVTNYKEYQDDAMDLRAFRYFDKPFDPQRLYSGLDKAMEYISESYIDLFVHKDGYHHRLLVDDIRYVMRENRKVVVVTSTDQITTTENFDYICQQLPNVFFYSVHKSFHVNLHYVKKYAYSELILDDGTRIPISSRRQAEFRKFWFEYLRRR